MSIPDWSNIYHVPFEETEKLLKECCLALEALGVMPDGYCFCSKNRDPAKDNHMGECKEAREIIEKVRIHLNLRT